MLRKPKPKGATLACRLCIINQRLSNCIVTQRQVFVSHIVKRIVSVASWTYLYT